MKEYPPDKVRNIALIGHGSTGKTSLAEAMLFASGATTRLGRVEDGTTVSDWDPDEQKRGLSVNPAVVPVEANGLKINVVDAPGYADFMGEVKCALRAAPRLLVRGEPAPRQPVHGGLVPLDERGQGLVIAAAVGGDEGRVVGARLGQ